MTEETKKDLKDLFIEVFESDEQKAKLEFTSPATAMRYLRDLKTVLKECKEKCIISQHPLIQKLYVLDLFKRSYIGIYENKKDLRLIVKNEKGYFNPKGTPWLKYEMESV